MMLTILGIVPALVLSVTLSAATNVLMVADEIPAMEVLAAKLKSAVGAESRIVTQEDMPADLSRYAAVFVYIHRGLGEAAEKAFIEYTQSGGKLILLHHSISSGKRKNKNWFPFLKISLPEGDVGQGGYKWIEGVTLEIANIAPGEFVTTQGVSYESTVRYEGAGNGRERDLPGFALEDTEVYLNHVLTAPRTLLLGLKYTDAGSGKTYMQDRAGWYMKSGQGWIFYFMAGHTARDFEHPAYARILANAVAFQPRE